MSTQYTPGPWFAEKENSHTGDVATCHWNGEEWWSVFSLNWSEGGSAEANARLIAAAPELLEALQSMLAIVDDSYGVAGYHLNGEIAPWGTFDEINSAYAAITKATGSMGGVK